MTLTHRGLSQRSLGTAELMSLGIAASCPMAVLAGAVVATLAVTGAVSMASSFLFLAIPLALFSVGFLSMSRDIPNAASFYAFLAHGLGPTVGLAGAAVSLLAYNVVQVSLYGLLGAIASGLFGGPWWVWAFVAWLIVGLAGVLHIGVNTRLLAAVLVLELVVISLMSFTGLRSPAGGDLDAGPLMPLNLLNSGSLGGVLAFGISSFIGFESVAVYREEAVSHKSVVWACYGSIAFLSVFYAISSWALVSAVGADSIVDTARDPSANLPFAILGDQYGPFVQSIGEALLIIGLLAALLSFHNVVARYVYSLAREGVLPADLGSLGGANRSVPVAGSMFQTSVAAAGVALFAIGGADPLATLFTLLSELSALGVLALMICTSLAALRFYHLRGTLDLKYGAAAVGSIVTLTLVLVVNIANMDSITNTDASTSLRWALPLVVVVTALAGALAARRIRVRKPVVYSSIGRGEPRPLAIPEQALADLEM